LNLTQTNFSRLARSTYCQRSGQIRTRRLLRMMTAHRHTSAAVVLETFQTYYATFRAVNPSTCNLSGSTGPLKRLSIVFSGGARTACRFQFSCPLKFQCAKTPEALKFDKDLVLEVLRFPLTCRGALSPTSSPVARAAYSGYYVLDASLYRGIQKSIPNRPSDVNASR
jgi:hypothetical protein